MRPKTRCRLAPKCFLFFVAFATTLGVAQPDATQSPEILTTLGQAMQWRLIGPFRAGRVTCVAGAPDDPTTYYFGTPGGGIWKTTDGGQVWKPIFDSVPIASIGALTLDPSDSSTLYAGTGEQTAGDGIYKSTDAGKTWTNVGLKDVPFIQSIIVDPKDSNILIVAGRGQRQSNTGGIYKSVDAGRSWHKTLSLEDDNTGIYDLTQSLEAPAMMYAASWHVARGGPRQRAEKQDGELFVSTDEGSTWKKVDGQGLPAEARGRIGVAAAPSHQGQVVYAILAQGLFRSDDAGAHWSRTTADSRIIGNGYFSRLFIDPSNANTIYAAQTSMYRSIDGGNTFEAWNGAPSGDDVHVLWINPLAPKHMMLGIDQGAVISVDGGESWSSWYNQPTGQFYHVITDDHFPYMVYASQQDSGTAGIFSRSDFGEITAQDWSPVGGFEFAFIAPDPLNSSLIYTGGWYGSVLRFDRTTKQVVPVFVRSEKYRTAGMAPTLFSPHDPHLLIVGSQYVMTSHDGGATWKEISPDLTHKADADSQKQTAVERERNAVITTLAVSRVRSDVIWAGTGNGLVQLSVDGKNWSDVTPPGLPAQSSIRMIEASNQGAAAAYAVINSPDQRNPAILRTRDNGKTWQSIVSGLRENRRVNVVREDLVDKDLLFAGTDDGAYFSLDSGDDWQSLQLDLPTTPVSDLEIHGDDLVASTYGRSLWILDNITPLRQTRELSTNPTAHLLQPAKAVRARWDMNQDTPYPREVPAAKNPPDGAIIDYFLAAPAGDLKLEVYDSNGKLVRTITTKPEEVDTALSNVPAYWFAKPTVLPNHTGVNRFVWDFRYPAPKTLRYSYFGNATDYIEYTLADHAIPGEFPRQQPMGALVLPGRYKLVLTANGQTYSRELEVAPDPRVHVSSADLAEQLKLERIASKAMDLTYDVTTGTRALLDSLRDQLKESGTATKKSTAATRLTDLQKKAEEIANHEHTDLGFGPANRELARLFEMISGGGDARPAAPLAEGIQDICHDVAKRLEQWRDLNEKEIPTINAVGTNKLPVAGNIPVSLDCQ